MSFKYLFIKNQYINFHVNQYKSDNLIILKTCFASIIIQCTLYSEKAV